MPKHKIEVDDDVYRYLKSKAEPFVDTPNIVLRRELLGDNGSQSANSAQRMLHLPSSMPRALEQILQVIHLTKVEGYTRLEATHAIAHNLKVEIQTVTDKYTRQLGITAGKFDRLLAEPNLSELTKRLSDRFKGYESTIKQFLSQRDLDN